MGHWRTGRQESAATGAAAGSGSAEVLPGGNTSGQVVRIDGTVRKRWEPGTQTVHEYLAHLRARGIDVHLYKARKGSAKNADNEIVKN